MKNIYPNLYYTKVEKITIQELIKNKIKLLILDVDNTLIDYYKNLSDSVINWSKEMKGQGIKLYILSNTNDKENVKKQLQELVDNFSVDDEIDMYRQDANYKRNFTISQSLEDFTEYQKKLEDLANNFNTKYHELIYQKFMNNELQKEEMQL